MYKEHYIIVECIKLHQTLSLCNLDSTTKRKKLELLTQYSLFGNIECLQAVRLAGNSRDSLLLSFKDAKVCCRSCSCLFLKRNYSVLALYGYFII